MAFEQQQRRNDRVDENGAGEREDAAGFCQRRARDDPSLGGIRSETEV
jgi:hypothetical protein